MAGQMKGMSRNADTQSSLLWEIERLIESTKDKPKYLIMENVPTLVGKKFMGFFQIWLDFLDKLGYRNYWQCLNARNYGVAQNRDRVFMVSILGDESYIFPKHKRLTTKLKDYLEEEVEEKYFLSDKMLKYLTDMTDRNGFVRGKRFNPHTIDSEYAYAITTNAGNRPTDNFIIMPEKTKKGNVEAREGDGVYIDRPHQKRGVVQKGMIQTLKTSGQDLGVVVKIPEDNRNKKEKLCDNLIEKGIVKEWDVITHSYPRKQVLEKSIESVNGIMPTLTTRLDTFGVVVKRKNHLNIRKLTPLESWRLMGWGDEDFEKVKNFSDTTLYRLAGNSVVVPVLKEIFRTLFIDKCEVDLDYHKQLKLF
jgi:DNA (cytosine-5)-methyltransferase 1